MIADLRLRVGMQYGRSVITDQYFTSPIKIGLLVNHDDHLDIILMMASAGILKDDEFTYEIICESGTKTRLVEQSYTKIFDTGKGRAYKRKHISLHGTASLYDQSSVVIPFQNSWFESDTVVDLQRNSEFAWADILAGGRIAMQERFAFRHYRSRMCVKIEGNPVWLDQCLLEPEWMDAEGIYFFDGYTHQGSFYYYGTEEKQKRILQWRNLAVNRWKELAIIGVSEARQGICVRALANAAQNLEEIFADLAQLLELTV